MAYDSDGFGVNGDVSQRGQGPTAFTYRSLTDDKETILGSGYFAGAKDYLDVGSQISCQGANGSFLGIVSGLSPVTVVDIGLTAMQIAMQEPSGFPTSSDGEVDRASSQLSWDDGTRTLTISPTATSFEVWVQGVSYTIEEARSVTITDSEGLWYFYFDNDGVLKASNTFSLEFIYNTGYCASGYWDSDNKKLLFGGSFDERHGCKMDGHTHARIHFGDGPGYRNGFLLTDIQSDQAGDADSHAQFGVQSGEFFDEDIRFSVGALASNAGVARVVYKDSSSNWRESSPTSGFSVLNTGTGRLAYNPSSTGGLSEVPNNSLVLYHLIATSGTNSTGQLFTVPGLQTYTNVVDLRNNSQKEINDLLTSLDGLPAPEFLVLASVGFQTSDAYSNAVKARIRTLDDGGDYYFYPKSKLSVEKITG